MIKQNIEDVKKTLAKHGFPQDVIIETTARCNLSCIMCPQKSLMRNRGDMSYYTYRKIIDEVAKESIKSRVWLAIMGEPLIVGKKIAEMISYAKHCGLFVCLNTNAVLMDDLMCRRLINSKLDEIYIGIDAVTPETYSKIRVGGNYKDVVKNTLNLISLKSNIKVITQFIEMDENCHETELFKQFWIDNGATVKIRPKLGWGTGVATNNLIIEKRDIPCSWLTRTVSIHWDGTIAQCDADWDDKYNIGSIENMTIKEAWNGELKKRRDKHWNLDFDFLPCSECKDWQAGRSYYYGNKND